MTVAISIFLKAERKRVIKFKWNKIISINIGGKIWEIAAAYHTDVYHILNKILTFKCSSNNEYIPN